MTKSTKFVGIFAASVLAASSIASAGFINYNAALATAGPEAWNLTNTQWQATNPNDASPLRLIADYDAPTSSTNALNFWGEITSDPTFDLLQRVKNNGTVPWTGFIVTITPGVNSTVSNLVGRAAGDPGSLTSNFSVANVVGNQIIYSGGTVNVGDTVLLDLSFDVDVTVGLDPGLHFSYIIDNTPVAIPEPSSLGILATGATLLTRRRRA